MMDLFQYMDTHVDWVYPVIYALGVFTLWLFYIEATE